tara:strand:+ start:872 stop:1012 length:141 start_codon:yes stop_codon:yes gene_type:complete
MSLLLTHWKDEEGNNWYKFKKKDIDLFTKELYNQKFEEIIEEEYDR